MKQILRGFFEALFGRELELRVRLFHVLAITGVVICIIMTGVSIAGEMWISAGINFVTGVISLWLLLYSARKKRYQFCYYVSIGVIFFMLFPTLFFVGGGYQGGMSFFFVFAAVFTVYMLDGWMMLAVTTLELVFYSYLCQLVYLHPESVLPFASEQAVVVDIIVGMVTVSIALGGTMFVQVRMYRKQQNELEQARRTADAANQAKSAFLANMSHEVRTPIHMILGMNEIIHRESGSSAVQDYSEKIEETGKMLLSLVDSVLDVSKIESGKMELIPAPYETANLVRNLILIGRTHCKKKNLEFRTVIEEDLPQRMYGDLAHIRQIATNFLSNSAKYTESGTVTLRVGQEPGRSEDEIFLVISVQDTGIGIAEEAVPTIFDAFTRSNLSAHRYIEGTGLGLKIVKELTELMNGTVSVTSEQDVGSMFTVKLPQKILCAEPDQQQNTTRSFQAPRARILVVDDNEGNRSLMQKLLLPTKIRVDLADSGLTCLRQVQRNHYDLILMDYMMPGMDGLETMQALKRMADFQTPVIGLTADAAAETREKLMAAGFTECLTKPVPWSVLQESLLDRLPRELVRIIVEPEQQLPDRKELAELEKQLKSYGIAVDAAMQYFEGSLEQYIGMAEVFLRRDEEEACKINAYSDPVDCEQLRFVIHAMKGKTKNLGLSQLSAVCAHLEKLCHAGDTAEIHSLMPYFQFLWKRGRNGLQLLVSHRKPAPAVSGGTGDDCISELRELLREFRRNPSLECISRLMSEEPSQEGRRQLEQLRTLVDSISFEQAETVLNDYLKWKEGNPQ